MSRKPLLTTAVASMFAGELFLMHPNIATHEISWPMAFALWLAFGVSAGYAGDTIYNRSHVKTKGALVRFFLLSAIIAVIFLAAFIFSRVVFWIF